MHMASPTPLHCVCVLCSMGEAGGRDNSLLTACYSIPLFSSVYCTVDSEYCNGKHANKVDGYSYM